MGSSFSCTGTNALDDRLEALFMRSISFDEDIADSTLRSVSFNGRDAEPRIFKAFNSGKLIIKGSLSFQGREMETEISIESPNSEKEKPRGLQKSRFSQLKVIVPQQPVIEDTPKHEAALKLQKVYKSFRTRRQLADCAVLVEQRWWKLLDFALLKHSSVSFFDIEKPETAVSRWSRARMRAAKVGKGLSKDEKARKLALQHWLEAIDPRHRYGHNLHFYYVSWLNCESKQPFFYWLDVGEGREVNLEERCPRSKLQQQCIKYLGPKEREAYEVIVEDGKFYHKQDKKLIDTSEDPNDTKWIFVLSTSKKLYIGQKKKGSFQHSSFLAGGATSAAGRLVVEKGILKAVWPHSGHYRPTVENFQEFMSFLKERNVDLSDVKESPTDDDEGSYSQSGLASNDSELDLTISDIPACYGKEDQTSLISSGVTSSIAVPERTTSFAAKKQVVFGDLTAEFNLDEHQTAEKSSNLEQCQHKQDVPKDKKKSETAAAEADGKQLRSSGIMAVNSEKESATAQPFMFRKRNLFMEENEEDGEAYVPKELILHRISSKKGMKSLQLGKQLSCKWTTGAGPRIGFVRDYPTELQFRSLEQVHLSPKRETPPRLYVSPGNIASPCPKTLASPLLPKHQK